MSGFLGSASLWLIVAVLIFWAVGAHNRLVRLRAEVHAAFGGVDAQWASVVSTLLPVLDGAVATHDPTAGSDPRPPLRAALLQVEATLAAARSRALDVERIAALALAIQTFGQAWIKSALCVQPAFGEVGAVLSAPDTGIADEPPPSARLIWERSQPALQSAQTRMAAAVLAYNQAIAQFPARVIAWAFGFRPARSLEPLG